MNPVYLLTWRAMGCDVAVQLQSDTDASGLLKLLPAQVEAVEAQLSRFRPESELMKLNRQAGEWVKVSHVLFENVIAAKQAARLTEGDFNPLVLPSMVANGYNRSFSELTQVYTTEPVPAGDWHAIEVRNVAREVRIPAGSALDLGGITKGWTAAQVAGMLKPYGACLVNMGGDLVGWGMPNDLPGWRVTLNDPLSNRPLGRVWLRNTSIVTSGVDYRRWTDDHGNLQHHIINPHTGQAARTDVASVTVMHPHAPTAEAYAKAVLLRGADAGLMWLQQQWNAAGLVVRNDGAVLSTAHFLNVFDEKDID